MEYFLIEKGMERKMELEEILPIYGIGLQGILRDTFGYSYLPLALAHLPDETKKLVYLHSLSRFRGRLEKDIEDAEARFKKDDIKIQNARAELISFIGENRRLPFWVSDSVIKVKQPKKPVSDFLKLINDIENACVSGRLWLHSSYTNKMSEKDVQSAFMAFQDRKDELKKIRHLDIDIKDLPAAAILFEAGGIDTLDINGKFDGTWPVLLENYCNLTSICLNVEGVTEFPAWIRDVLSLRCLSIGQFDGTQLPDWIGDMQSLTEIDIRCSYNNKVLKALPDSVCKLKNLAKLSVSGSAFEKLPDSIGDLSSLKELFLSGNKNIRFLPYSIGKLKNLDKLTIYGSETINDTALEKLPDSIGDLSSLKEFSLLGNINLKSLPDSLGNLKGLIHLSIDHSALEKLPDSIGDLSSLKRLSMYNNFNLKSLPDSIGNLKNLAEFYLRFSRVKTLPDSIGNLQNLATLILYGSNIEKLPDSIGRLKKMATLNLCCSGIEKLPDTIADCASLECLDIRKTKITSVPDSISSIKEIKRTIEVIPKKRSISYLSFCNSYYALVDTIIKFDLKARREGILALEDELETISDGFFLEGIRLVLDGNEEEIIRRILTLKTDRERDYYKKKLMEVATEGVLCVFRRDDIPDVAIKLASMVDIKNNPLDAACAAYLTGDDGAFYDIDFKALIQPEKEREEILFIKRAIEIHKMDRDEGIVGIEKRLDRDGIAAKDVFEYGISLLVIGMDYKDIDKYMTILTDRETDPVRKNFSLAKKEAVRMLYEGCNPQQLKETLLASFDEDVRDV